MKCNNCNTEMVPGEAALKYTGWGIAIFGASFKHLFFKPEGSGPKDKVLILKNNDVATAHKCEQCGATTILPDGARRSLVHW